MVGTMVLWTRAVAVVKNSDLSWLVWEWSQNKTQAGPRAAFGDII